MSKSKIVISDLSLPESLSSISEKEQKQVIGGRQDPGTPLPPEHKYSMTYVYPLEPYRGVLEA